ncbi:MAG: SDR family oxidoreductase [Gammaproteobacteria bacterium]|nr:SDR family oxidoreductase [Gammaproteobacteria bacterium]
MTRPAIFITGAAAGIGRATAELFASRGWFVGLYDVNEAGVQALRRALGEADAVAGRLDVTDAAAFGCALAGFWDAAGSRLDVLFNNAGTVSVGDFEAIPLERHREIAVVNYQGVLNGLHLALPYLKRTPRARAISMSSASAIYGTPAYASYSATKFAVKGLTEALNIEWQRHGILVMDVLPLFVNTAMVTEIEAPLSLRRIGVHYEARDVARTVWRAAHWPRVWPRVHWYPGLRTALLALLNKLLPAWLNRFTAKRISGY